MKKYTILFLMSVVFLSGSSAFAADARDTDVDAKMFMPAANDTSATDGKATVYQVEGKALLTKKGNPAEREVKKGDVIEAGDKIYTEKGANLSIAFDNQHNNAVRLPADTKVIFTSIEPTDIRLEDGSVFNVVNGLTKGSTWKVTTPSTVAAVRGTVFVVTYQATTGEFFAATVNVPNDGKTSAIDIQSVDGSGSAVVGEGKELTLKQGEAPSQDVVKELSPEQISQAQQFFEQVTAEKKSDDKNNSGGPGGPGGPGGGSGPGGPGGANSSTTTTGNNSTSTIAGAAGGTPNPNMTSPLLTAGLPFNAMTPPPSGGMMPSGPGAAALLGTNSPSGPSATSVQNGSDVPMPVNLGDGPMSGGPGGAPPEIPQPPTGYLPPPDPITGNPAVNLEKFLPAGCTDASSCEALFKNSGTCSCHGQSGCPC